MNLRILVRLLLAPALLLPLAIPSAHAFSGMLSSSDMAVLGTGNWIIRGPTTIAWEVMQNADQTWHYLYTFCHPRGDTSHFILETSANFTEDDIFNECGDFGRIEIGLHRRSSGCPNMPEDVFGIKFDNARKQTSRFEFDSYRAPVWGDFYSKNGTAGGYGINTAWNAGFTALDIDPTDPIGDGSVACHLLTPDTMTAIPEPTSLLLLGAGALILAIRRRL